MAAHDDTKREGDTRVLHHIRELVDDEQKLYAQGSLDANERERLRKIQIELDQCWDYLRQRQALRDAGRNPDQAKVRPPSVVENYEQ